MTVFHIDRKKAILSVLKKHETATVQELVDATGASESTIRRDLTDLESQQLIKRLHGGASLSKRKMEEPSMSEKESVNQTEKQAIAQAASTFVEHRHCLFIDAGTSTIELIPFLHNKEVIVVTNGIHHVPLLLENGIETYVTGGKAKPHTAALTGDKAVESVEAFRFDICFLGMNGVDGRQGFTTPDPEEAVVKKTAMSLAAQSYVLADHSKIGEVSFASVASVDQAAIVTTNKVDEHTLQQLQQETAVKVVNL
ncbi:DeoR/GlpR family DNA-binding transcription regulator [Alteribacillus persepolensis]|uniref:DeoR/GlpR family DNA-binding transcription regulator n=1 Tax=Alteribacillus persepolensis TaxID=568899 RepID=UPI002ADD6AC5|nr:DeoR/GlpR family DNA-binding transcription regulator [Alteribacillus persepolensis]